MKRSSRRRVSRNEYTLIVNAYRNSRLLDEMKHRRHAIIYKPHISSARKFLLSYSIGHHSKGQHPTSKHFNQVGSYLPSLLRLLCFDFFASTFLLRLLALIHHRLSKSTKSSSSSSTLHNPKTSTPSKRCLPVGALTGLSARTSQGGQCAKESKRSVSGTRSRVLTWRSW